jgi:hypothetical protein
MEINAEKARWDFVRDAQPNFDLGPQLVEVERRAGAGKQ